MMIRPHIHQTQQFQHATRSTSMIGLNRSTIKTTSKQTSNPTVWPCNHYYKYTVDWIVPQFHQRWTHTYESDRIPQPDRKPNHTVTITIMTMKQFHNLARKTYNHKYDSDRIPQPDRKSNHTTTFIRNYIYAMMTKYQLTTTITNKCTMGMNEMDDKWPQYDWWHCSVKNSF